MLAIYVFSFISRVRAAGFLSIEQVQLTALVVRGLRRAFRCLSVLELSELHARDAISN